MAPRSPTLAFDPTPALEHSKFSEFNGSEQGSPTDNVHDLSVKEVRFQEPYLIEPTSFHGRHSIATSNVPLLPPVSSASHIPKQSFRIMNPPSQGVDITAYFEQCRNINEQLRSTQEQERKAWEIERTALKTRIADLEFKLNKAGGGRRRLSNDSHQTISRPFKSDFVIHAHPRVNGHRHNTVSSYPPMEDPRQEQVKPIWEPASPLPVTRVFSNDDADVQHLPRISEDAMLDDSNSLSPQTTRERKSIPIQEIDGALDGINVRSGGVRSSFHKILSPLMVASPAQVPSPNRGNLPDPPRFHLDPLSLLDPLDAKLRKNAGHTPLAYDGVLSATGTTGPATPLPEQPEQPAAPVPPAPTARIPPRPSERSQSYFSHEDYHNKSDQETTKTEAIDNDQTKEQSQEPTEPQAIFEPSEGDKPLTGPLMLDGSGKSEASHSFLDKLDEKLEEVVRRSHSNSPSRPTEGKERENQPPASSKRDEDDMPMLRLKKSTNFGSAYGARKPGSWGF